MTDTASSSSHKIVVGVDGSDSSLQALDWAARQAALTQSVLEVVTTWDHDQEGDARDLLDRVLGPTRKEYPGLQIQPVVIEGHPAPTLIARSRGADLLVVGSRGHGGFSGMLVGSVSQHCVGHSHCPVLVVRHRVMSDIGEYLLFRDADEETREAFIRGGHTNGVFDAHVPGEWKCSVCGRQTDLDDIGIVVGGANAGEPVCPVKNCDAHGWDQVRPAVG